MMVDSHAGCVVMGTACPAPQVQGALVESLAVAGREEVGGEQDEGVGPHQEGVFHTPPPVVVGVAL